MILHKDKYILASVLAGISGAIMLYLMGHHPNDDAYITFRHSWNLAEHLRFAWNLEGQADMGSSSPLMALLLGLAGIVLGGAAIPYIAFYLNILVLIASGPVIYLVMKLLTENKALSLLASFVICLNSYNIRIYSQGFEAGLFLWLFFLVLLLLYHEKNLWGYLLAGCLPLIRVEGVLVFALIGGLAVYRKKISIEVLLCLVVPLLWIVFSVLYYDQVLPQSIMAKKIFKKHHPVYKLLQGNGEQGPLAIGMHVLVGTWDVLLKPVLLFNAEPGVMQLNLPYKPGNFLFAKKPQLLAAISFSVIMNLIVFWKQRKLDKLIFYSYIAFFPVFIMYTWRVEFWYLPIWNVSVLILIFSGFYNLTKTAKSGILQNKSVQWILHGIAYGIIILFAFKNLYVINDGTRESDEHRGIVYVPALVDRHEFDRYFAYKNTALDHLQKNRTVMTTEVGVFGFFYEGVVYDLHGLTSSNVIEIYKKNEQAQKEDVLDPLSVVVELKPYYLVGSWLQGLSPHQYKQLKDLHYKLVYTDPKNTIWGLKMEVWEKKP